MAKTKQPKKNRAAAARAIVQEFELPDAQVVVPTAPPVSNRAPFWSRGFSKEEPCAGYYVGPACMVNGKKLTPTKLGLKKPTMQELTIACKRVGGTLRKAYTKDNRPGRVEFALLSPAQAKRIGTLPGPNMRLCITDNQPGVVMPVASPDAAAALQQEFTACVGGKKSKAKACALKLGQKTGSGRLGGLFGGLLKGGR